LRLNRDVEVRDSICFTSIWTPFDLVIVLAHSSRVPVGRSIRVRTTAHRYWSAIHNYCGWFSEP